MFRGFTRRELHLTMAFVALVGVARVVESARTEKQYQFQYSGRAIEHRPGELADTDVAAPSVLPKSATSRDIALIDLNKASAETIESLPGIGPSKAKTIVDWRDQNGGFRTVDDLDGVPGIGVATIDQLRSYVTVSDPSPIVEVAIAPVVTPAAESTVPPSPTPPLASPAPSPPPMTAVAVININQATIAELDTLDGIGPQLAGRIVQDRAANGPFRSVDDLQRVKGIGPKLLERNRHRLTIR